MNNNNGGSRAKHRRTVMASLRPGRAVPRSGIARQTGLSPATISRITKELVRRKIVREVEEARSAVGRPSRSLEVNGKFGRVLGVSLLYPAARALVLDMEGRVLREERRALTWTRGRRGVLDPLKSLVRSLTRGRRRKPGFLALGLAIPGQWDRETGISIQYPRVTAWKDVPIRMLVRKWSGLPVSLVGHAPALALAERASREGDEVPGLLAVEVSDNIAMGVISNGSLLEGASGSAGELGHITIDPDGPVCYCGNTGCLETLASCRAVAEGWSAHEPARGSRRGATFERAVERARRGDPFASRLLGRTAASLGIGLAAAVNLFNPDVVVLSGRFFDAGDRVMKPLRDSLFNRALQNTTRKIAIERSTLGPRAAALGAGLRAIHEALMNL